MSKVSKLEESFVVVGPQFHADSIAVTESFFTELGERYDDFKGHTLISSFSFEKDWPTWEIHPNGDELVYLLSGSANFILREPDGDREVMLDTPGQFVIVPRNTWHTAKVNSNAKMLFVTPGEGTENREVPPE